MAKICRFLQGKKTVLISVLTLLFTAVGFWRGDLTVLQAIQMFGFVGIALGLGDKLQRYLPQILIGLQGLATAIADLKAGQPVAGVEAIEGVAARLLPTIAAETGLHITGDPDHVSAFIDAISSPQLSTLVHTYPSQNAPTAVPGANS
jgi:hypothetical protein